MESQYYPIHFDDQMHIPRFDKDPSSEYSPDGKLFACWKLLCPSPGLTPWQVSNVLDE